MRAVLLGALKLSLLVLSFYHFLNDEIQLAIYFAVLILVLTDAYPPEGVKFKK